MARSVSHVPSPGSPSVDTADGFASLTLIYGVVASHPVRRDVSGVTLLDIDVRSKSTAGQPASVSVVWAAAGDAEPSEGDLVLVLGFTRRRFFRSGGVTVSRTEVEATSLLVNPDRRKRRRVVESSGVALERLTG